jgi:hypothetical protein
VMAVGTMWAIGIHLYKVKLPWMHIAKVAAISILASLTAHSVAIHFSPLWAVVLGGGAAMVVLLGLLYVLRVLKPEDCARFGALTRMLPRSLAAPVDKILSLLTHPGSVNTAAANV